MDDATIMEMARRMGGGHPMSEVRGKQDVITARRSFAFAQSAAKAQAVETAKAELAHAVELKAQQIQITKDAVKNGNA